MTQTQQALLSLVAQALFGLQTSVEPTPEILQEAKSQAVSALVNQDYHTIAQNIRVHHAHAQVTEILHGIPFTTIKGYASAYYYPNLCCRSMGDVDFIVPAQFFDRTTERLINAGWEKKNYENELHDAFSKNGISYELHREVNGLPNSKNGLKTINIQTEKTQSYDD